MHRHTLTHKVHERLSDPSINLQGNLILHDDVPSKIACKVVVSHGCDKIIWSRQNFSLAQHLQGFIVLICKQQDTHTRAHKHSESTNMFARARAQTRMHAHKESKRMCLIRRTRRGNRLSSKTQIGDINTKTKKAATNPRNTSNTSTSKRTRLAQRHK